MSARIPCYLVRERSDKVTGSVEAIHEQDLPPGEVTIDVECSSLNYKDALACKGHPGIATNLPHIPGIDCSGVVSQSESEEYQPGDRVLLTGYDFGVSHWGGFCAKVRVSAEWVVPLPAELSSRDAMLYGTAGFTAAQCVMAITERIQPEDGEVLVTGATGGVGVWSVALLSKLGYQVVAASGKPERKAALIQIGATRVVPREEILGDPARPLLKSVWAAAVDTVGGEPLSSVIRSIKYRGVVASCGLVAGDRTDLSLYPLLLRGMTLAGIDSAKCPRDSRLEIWRRLSGVWRIDLPDELIHEGNLADVSTLATEMLQGERFGRTLITPQAEG